MRKHAEPSSKSSLRSPLVDGSLAIFLFVSAIFLSGSAALTASDWVSIGPSGKSVVGLAVSPNYAYDGIIYVVADGLYRSTNKGQTWIKLNSGIDDGGTVLGIASLAVSPNLTVDGTIFAQTGTGLVFKSTDGGENWQRKSPTPIPPLYEDFVSLSISPGYASDQTLYAAAGAIYKSTDGGDNWVKLNGSLVQSGIARVVLSPSYPDDSTVFGAGRFGAVRSTDGGVTWSPADEGLTFSSSVNDIAFSPYFDSDGLVFAATDEGVYKSTDRGQSWSSFSAGIPTVNDVDIVNIYQLRISHSSTGDLALLANTDYGVYSIANGSGCWSRLGSFFYLIRSVIAISPDYAHDGTAFVGNEYGLLKHVRDSSDTSLPQPPSTVTPLPLKVNLIYLSWSPATDDSGTAGYVVERSENGVDFKTLAAQPVSERIWRDYSVHPDIGYYYRVWAIDLAGNGSASPSPVVFASSKKPTSGDCSGDGRADLIAYYDYGKATTAAWLFKTVNRNSNALGLSFELIHSWHGWPGELDMSRTLFVHGDFYGSGYSTVAAFFSKGQANSALWMSGTALNGMFEYFSLSSWDWSKTKLAAGDFDADGEDDIIAAYDYGGGSTGLWLLKWDPNPGPGSMYILKPRMVFFSKYWNWGKSRLLTVRDGAKSKLVIAYDYGEASTGLWVFELKADGKLGAPKLVFISHQWSPSNSTFITGDVNGDGRGDVVAFYNYGGSTTGVFTFRSSTDTQGKTTFAYPQRVYQSSQWNYRNSTFLPGDFDGDGKGDAAAVYDYGGKIGIWIFRSNGVRLTDPVLVLNSLSWSNAATKWVKPY